MVTFKLPLSMLLIFLLHNIFLCSGEVLYLPVTKDSSTLQYITELSQRTPLVPIQLLVHLGGRSLWVDCDKGFKSSTYKPGVCNSTQCTYSNPIYCGDCIKKPKLQPGCNNNSCHIWGENPLIDLYDDSAEIADDVLVIGSTPVVRLTWPQFIFACFVNRDMVRQLANGVTGKDVPLNKTLLSINKKDVDGGTRISTATPITILHPSIYDAFKSVFINALPKNVALVEPPMKQFEICFSSKNFKNTNIGPDVPVIDIVLHRPSAFWRIYGINSVIKVSEDVMCLAFMRQDQQRKPSIEIGGHQLEENLLVFDLSRKKIGFSSSLKLQQISCSMYDNTILG